MQTQTTSSVPSFDGWGAEFGLAASESPAWPRTLQLCGREVRIAALGGWAGAALATGGGLRFSGRLDNRSELQDALGSTTRLASPHGSAASDAELAARAYERWGHKGFRRLLGPFAIALWDARRATFILARDPLGGRSLSYSSSPGLLVAGSDPSDILADPRISDELDPYWLASYFALEEPAAGRTPFARIRELPPGHWLEIDAEGEALRPFQTLDDWLQAAATAQPSSADQIADELFDRLQRAVESRLPTVAGERQQQSSKPAVLMSGGLDSVPIAASARQILGVATPLLAVSWVFPGHPRADESQLINEVVDQLKLESIQLDCSAELPVGDPASWPLHPATPEQNPYRRFHQKSYMAAAAAGARVLLSGMCGDQLWSGAETWLGDSLRRGRPGQALSELAWQLRHRSMIRPELPRWLRAAHRRLRPSNHLSWLSPRARKLLADQPTQSYDAFPRPHQAKLLLGSANGHGFAVEARFARQAGIELRYPLRDRRLIELALGLPTSAIYSHGVERVAWRRALAGSIPDSVARRRDKASFVDLFAKGIYRQNQRQIAALLSRPAAVWPEYVRPQLIDQALQRHDTGFAGLQLWLALSLELWLDHRQGLPGGPVQ